MDINFDSNIRKHINQELARLPIHLRNDPMSEACHDSALSIIRKAGLDKISPRELYVLGAKLRDMLKSSHANKRWDYNTLSITPDDEERGGESLYQSINVIAREISSIYITGTTPIENNPVVHTMYCKDFCQSLLWLITLGLGVNLDLHDDYFK